MLLRCLEEGEDPPAMRQRATLLAVPRLLAACEELAGHAVPPSLVHGDPHLVVGYRSIVARLQPPVDRHIAGSTAWCWPTCPADRLS